MLVDDYVLVCSGIKVLLIVMLGVEVVGEVFDGVEVIEMIFQLKFDLVLLDIVMKGMNGLEVLCCLWGEYLIICFLMLFMYGSEEYVMQVLNVGVNGYFFKDLVVIELEKVLYEVKYGCQYLDLYILCEVFDNYMKCVV